MSSAKFSAASGNRSVDVSANAHAASSRSANAFSISLRTAAVGCPCRCKRRSLFHSLMISRSRSASMVANLRDLNDRTNKEQPPEILDVAALELGDTADIDPYEDGQGNSSAGTDRRTRGVHDQGRRAGRSDAQPSAGFPRPGRHDE